MISNVLSFVHRDNIIGDLSFRITVSEFGWIYYSEILAAGLLCGNVINGNMKRQL